MQRPLLSSQQFGVKLLDYHGGQYTGLYSVGSCLLAGEAPPEGQIVRALDELKPFISTDPEARALRAALVEYLKLDEFTRAYIEAALWSTADGDRGTLDEKYTLAHFAPETVARFAADCAAFQAANADDIDAGCKKARSCTDREYAGHDFWLTRNGHGCGFWDGDWPEEAATRLTAASKAFGELDLYAGDDGKLHC